MDVIRPKVRFPIVALGKPSCGVLNRLKNSVLNKTLADSRKGIPMREALASEIMDAYQGQGNAIRKRDEVHKMAQANKAFAHFRW